MLSSVTSVLIVSTPKQLAAWDHAAIIGLPAERVVALDICNVLPTAVATASACRNFETPGIGASCLTSFDNAGCCLGSMTHNPSR